MQVEHVGQAVVAHGGVDLGELGAVLHHLADRAAHVAVRVRPHRADVDHVAVAGDLTPGVHQAALSNTPP
jgi:hypothetical protein